MKKPGRLAILKGFGIISLWNCAFFLIYIIPSIREHLLGSFTTASRYSTVKLIENLFTTYGWVSVLFGFLNARTNGELYRSDVLPLLEIAAWLVFTGLAAYLLALILTNIKASRD